MSDLAAALPVGGRVVVRWRLESADEATGATLTDTVGTLTASDEHRLTVETSRGVVVVERARLVAAKELPPRPTRRGAPHRAIGIDDLQRVSAASWGAVEHEQLGEWQLRASSGFSQRGNSVVPVGDPGLPLGDAVTEVEHWYAARGLPAKFAVAGPRGFDPGDDALGRLLQQRGYTTASLTLNLTASTDTVAAADPGGPMVVTTTELPDRWLEAYRRTRTTVPGATAQVLMGSPRQLFGHIAPGGGLSQQLGLRPADAAGTAPIALGRVGIAHGWAGLGAVWTDPAYRGRGLATHLTAQLAAQARREGVHLIHLQVEHDNAAAIGLYRRMGFDLHSSYVYLTQASPG